MEKIKIAIGLLFLASTVSTVKGETIQLGTWSSWIGQDPVPVALEVQGSTTTTVGGTLTFKLVLKNQDNEEVGIFTVLNPGPPPVHMTATYRVVTPVGSVSVSDNVISIGQITQTGSHTVIFTGVAELPEWGGIPPLSYLGGTVSLSATISILVEGVIPSRIEIVPTAASVTVGSNYTFVLKVYDQYGRLIEGIGGTWTANTNIGTVSPQTGTYTVLSAATKTTTGTVTVQVGTLTAVSIVELIAGTATTLVITPATTTMSVGGSQIITSFIYDRFGNSVPNSQIKKWDWDASEGIIMGSGSTIVYNATTPGTVTIELQVETWSDIKLNATATIIVKELGTLTTILITPGSTTIQVGSSAVFSAQGYDQYGSPISGLTYNWLTRIGSITVGSLTSQITFTASTRTITGTIAVTVDGVVGIATVTILPGPMQGAILLDNPRVAYANHNYQGTVTIIFIDSYGNNTAAPINAKLYGLWHTDDLTKNVGVIGNTTAQKWEVGGLKTFDFSAGSFKPGRERQINFGPEGLQTKIRFFIIL